MQVPGSQRLSSILLVDDDPATIRILHRLLDGCGTIRFSTSAEEGLQLARESATDLILLDLEMPQMSGVAFCRRIKADPATASTAVIFVTSHDDPAAEIEAFEAGASDFITKPIQPAVVRARVATQLRLKHLTDMLRDAALRDGLTGLGNRLALSGRLGEEWRRAQRSGAPLSLLMIDVDHFKQFNDRYGHLAGDAVLRQVADTLQQFARRSGDFAVRFGGEEFVLVLPATEAAVAREAAERLRREIDGARYAIDGVAGPVRLTVSVGVATGVPSATDSGDAGMPQTEALLRTADTALYRAKAQGRNCVVVTAAQAGGSTSG